MRYYPIFVDLRGRRCVVVGGGRVAERHVRSLLRAGATVRVISPDLTSRLVSLEATRKIKVTLRAFRKGDLDRSFLVFAATNDLGAQKQIWEEARHLRALVTSVTGSESSTFLVPALFERGDLRVAISTSGTSPALARRLRQQLEDSIGPEYGAHLRLLKEARKQILRYVPSQKERAKILRRFAASTMTGGPRTSAPGRLAGNVSRMLAKLGVKTSEISSGREPSGIKTKSGKSHGGF